MGQAVVLRSRYTLVRTLLVVSTIAVVALTVAVAILAADGGQTNHTSTTASNPAVSHATVGPAPGIRYDGGPEEGTRGIVRTWTPPVSHYNGPH
jgi:hypothetical protein